MAVTSRRASCSARWLTARDNSHHLRSAHLAEQAGRAFLEAGHADKAALYARQAVQRFIAARRPGRAVRALQHAVAALRSRGFDAQAAALEQDAQEQLASRLEPGNPPSRTRAAAERPPPADLSAMWRPAPRRPSRLDRFGFGGMSLLRLQRVDQARMK